MDIQCAARKWLFHKGITTFDKRAFHGFPCIAIRNSILLNELSFHIVEHLLPHLVRHGYQLLPCRAVNLSIFAMIHSRNHHATRSYKIPVRIPAVRNYCLIY